MKKVIFSLTVLLTLAVLLTACGGGGGVREFSFEPDDNVTAPGEFPVCKEPIDMVIGIRQNPNVDSYENNALTKWYTEKTNINFKFEMFPTAQQGMQKLQVLVASQSEMPEVLVGFGTNDVDIYKWGQAGAIVPLNEYIEEYGFYLKQAFEARPRLKPLMTMAEGEIYYIPNYVEQTGNQWSQRVLINTKWLDKLRLSMPQTTDDFYNVLKAFKTGDPNGNGKADEIPFAGSQNVWRAKVYDFLMNAFIYNDTDQFYVLEDGKLDFAYLKEEWRDGLRYMNMLYSEGLIAPQSFTQDGQQLRSMVENPEITILGVIPGSIGQFSPENERKLDYDVIPPLTGPKGVSWASHFPQAINSYFMITKDCKHPLAAFRWADLTMTKEATIRGRFGAPGTDWLEPASGDVSMYENLGFAPVLKPILSWASVQSSHWSEMTPGFRTNDISDGQVWNGNPLENEYLIARHVAPYIDRAPKETVSKLVYTGEEMDIIQEIRPAIKTYVDECIARFITGDMNLDTQWDSYLNELNKIGLEKYKEVAQKAHERNKR